MSKLSVKRAIPGELVIDGTPISIGVNRMDVDEFIQFEETYMAYGQLGPGTDITVPGEDAMSAEQITAARTAAMIDKQIRMTPDERALESKRLIARARELATWTAEKIKQYLTIVPGELDVDGEPVLTGADFLKLYGGRANLLTQAISLIWVMNKLPVHVGKSYVSLSASQPTSEGQPPAPAGPKPELTVDGAKPEASVETEGATAVR